MNSSLLETLVAATKASMISECLNDNDNDNDNDNENEIEFSFQIQFGTNISS
jgi:hypothetical protein